MVNKDHPQWIQARDNLLDPKALSLAFNLALLQSSLVPNISSVEIRYPSTISHKVESKQRSLRKVNDLLIAWQLHV